MKKPVIISTDPGIDDAVAIGIALHQLDVKLIVPIAGNVSLENTLKNTQKLLTFFNSPVKIVPGSSNPLLAKLETAEHIHGKTGLEGYDFPEPKYFPDESLTSSEAMHEVVSTSTTPVTLIGIGPLTDIALYLHQYPNDLNNIEELVIMGTSLGRGNQGVLSEFNIAVDPEAAAMVFSKNIKIRIAPLELGRQATISFESSQKIKDFGKTGEMFYSLFSKYRGGSLETGLRMYDPLAIALITTPDIFSFEDAQVQIETNSSLTYGASVIDFKSVNKNALVATNVKNDDFENWFVDSINELL